MKPNLVKLASEGYFDINKEAEFRETAKTQAKAAKNLIKGKAGAAGAFAKANPLKTGLGVAGTGAALGGIAYGANKLKQNRHQDQIETLASEYFSELEKIANESLMVPGDIIKHRKGVNKKVAAGLGAAGLAGAGALAYKNKKRNPIEEAIEVQASEIYSYLEKEASAGLPMAIDIGMNTVNAGQKIDPRLIAGGTAALIGGGALAHHIYQNKKDNPTEETTEEEVLAGLIYERALEKVAGIDEGAKHGLRAASRNMAGSVGGILGGSVAGSLAGVGASKLSKGKIDATNAAMLGANTGALGGYALGAYNSSKRAHNKISPGKGDAKLAGRLGVTLGPVANGVYTGYYANEADKAKDKEEVLAGMIYERALEKVAGPMDTAKYVGKNVVLPTAAGVGLGTAVNYGLFRNIQRENALRVGTQAYKDNQKVKQNLKDKINNPEAYSGIFGKAGKKGDERRLRGMEISEPGTTRMDTLKYSLLGK